MSSHQHNYDAIEHNKFTALLMDFRKAFDTMSQKIMHQKLLHYGIRGPAYGLAESYRSNRQLFISINSNAFDGFTLGFTSLSAETG